MTTPNLTLKLPHLKVGEAPALRKQPGAWPKPTQEVQT